MTDDMRAEGQALFGSGPATASSRSDPTAGAGAKRSGADSSATSRTASGSRATTPTGSAAGDADSGWAIILEYVGSDGGPRAAAARRAALATELGRSDVSIRSRSDGAAIVLGSYPSATDANAQADLEWVRSITRGKATPFARAFLVPPVVDTAASSAHPEWNLAGIRQTRVGQGKDLTLQVAVFGGGGNVDAARRAAEAYALDLRRAGEEAYYFHGPVLSVVTVGLFTSRDADSMGRPSSKSARDAQRAHPFNLAEGKDPIPDATGSPQTSALMRLP